MSNSKSYRLSEMTPEAVKEIIEQLKKPVTQSDIDAVNAELMQYEKKYNVSSKAMQKLVSEGLMQETDEVCSWLMLLHRRDRLIVKMKEQVS